ncbi:MAG TPA: tetratricopeptide repeat protein [Pyrinomonadaceae bacterium]|jgi:tetratricopeptide (TPR) repeat protein|nr:tetratricopeptide repeat protein [Pyrinomonadaceae bacterium]
MTNKFKLALILVGIAGTAAAVGWSVLAAGSAGHFIPPNGYEMPFGSSPFAPSNAQTTSGQLISQSDFIPARRCAKCHAATHLEWNQSAHRNAFREPFYQANVNHLIRERGIVVTRHCESCHNPAALFSGALSKNSKIERPFDEEGVSCSVCHSIQSVTTEGIGSYVIAPPALLELKDGRRIKDATDEEILADLGSHSRAVMRPLLQQPEFCATCHKSAIVPELNGRKWFRTFSVYDEWQQSAFAGETVQPLSVRPRQVCQSCHMPTQKLTGYASHRWPGGNTAIPAHYGWTEQGKATSDLLKAANVAVDIFAVHASAASQAESFAPIVNSSSIVPGQTLSVDVVVANRGVGHAFPAELRDMFEAWLEFQATDATGKVLIHSGAVRADGTLEWDAHAYRTVPIGDDGRQIDRHDIWHTRVGAFDRQIPAGRADIGRFTFDVPLTARGPIKLVARLNYRRFNSRFLDWVKRSQPVKQSPVVEMSSAAVVLQVAIQPKGKSAPTATTAKSPVESAELRKRWRAYGVALFDQQQYEAAAEAFEQARVLAAKGTADEAASSVDLALAYMKMERAGASQNVIAKANECIARALELAPTDGRVRFYSALLNIKQFRYSQALTDLEALAKERPRDRQVWSLLASTYLLQRRDKEAQIAYEHVLAIDPDDTEAHFKLGGLYWRFGLIDLAKVEQDNYQARHIDTVGETLRRNYLNAHPEIYSTWPWRPFGDNPIGTTP